MKFIINKNLDICVISDICVFITFIVFIIILNKRCCINERLAYYSFVSNHLIFRLTTLYSLTGLTNNKIES